MLVGARKVMPHAASTAISLGAPTPLRAVGWVVALLSLVLAAVAIARDSSLRRKYTLNPNPKPQVNPKP